MQIKILSYRTTQREATQAFVDVQIDDQLRLNGIHLQRNGTLQPAKLTPTVDGRIRFIPAVEVLDRALEERLTRQILQAIHDHVATLPAAERLKPPRPPEPRKSDERPEKTTAKPHNAPVHAKPAPTIRPVAPATPKPLQSTSTKQAPEKLKLQPPSRLLVQRRPL
jgi:hypothetical protein